MSNNKAQQPRQKNGGGNTTTPNNLGENNEDNNIKYRKTSIIKLIIENFSRKKQKNQYNAHYSGPTFPAALSPGL